MSEHTDIERESEEKTSYERTCSNCPGSFYACGMW